MERFIADNWNQPLGERRSAAGDSTAEFGWLIFYVCNSYFILPCHLTDSLY